MSRWSWRSVSAGLRVLAVASYAALWASRLVRMSKSRAPWATMFGALPIESAPAVVERHARRRLIIADERDSSHSVEVSAGRFAHGSGERSFSQWVAHAPALAAARTYRLIHRQLFRNGRREPPPRLKGPSRPFSGRLWMSGYADWMDVGVALGPPLAFLLTDQFGLRTNYSPTALILVAVGVWFTLAWRRR